MKNLDDVLENHLETLLNKVEILNGHFNKNTVSLGNKKVGKDIVSVAI
jgi:hypothetical protein